MHCSARGGSLWRADWRNHQKRKMMVAEDLASGQVEMVGTRMSGDLVESGASRARGKAESRVVDCEENP